MNAPDPHNWTLNSCFGVFISVWVHMGPFCYCTKLGAKWANLVKLMQIFVPQSLVRISQNECSRSTELDPKLMFLYVSFHLGAFGTILQLYETCFKTRQIGAINAKSQCHDVLLEFLLTNTPDPHHWTLNSCFGAIRSVWVHFGPFCYCTKLGAKRARPVQLMQKFEPRCHVGFFRKERSQSTTLDHKLMFWCVSFRLGASGTVSLLHKTSCKTSQTGAINTKIRATMSCQIFSQQMLPIHTIGP